MLWTNVPGLKKIRTESSTGVMGSDPALHFTVLGMFFLGQVLLALLIFFSVGGGLDKTTCFLPYQGLGRKGMVGIF